mgnify:CR=1 FL=1
MIHVHIYIYLCILIIVARHAYFHSDRCYATVRPFISNRLPTTCNWNLISRGNAKQVAVHCTMNDTVWQLRQFFLPFTHSRWFSGERYGILWFVAVCSSRFILSVINDRKQLVQHATYALEMRILSQRIFIFIFILIEEFYLSLNRLIQK